MLSQEEFQRQYEAILCPGDPGRVNRYVQAVWIKYQIAHYLQPSRIVELGVRAGYSAWAFLQGCPAAAIVAYDNFAPGNQGSYGHERQLMGHAEWVMDKIGGHLHHADTQQLGTLIKADLYHVDADHRFGPAYNDIVLCMKSNPDGVIVVHDANHADVHTAVKVALGSGRWIWANIDSEWGDAVLSKVRQDWLDDVVSFNPDLVKSDVGKEST